jgi:hypothetical protein
VKTVKKTWGLCEGKELLERQHDFKVFLKESFFLSWNLSGNGDNNWSIPALRLVVLENILNKIIIFLLPTSQSVPLERRLQTVLLIVYSFKWQDLGEKAEHHYHNYIALGEKALELRYRWRCSSYVGVTLPARSRNCLSIPSRAKDCSRIHNGQTTSDAYQNSYSVRTGGSSSRLSNLCVGANYSHLTTKWLELCLHSPIRLYGGHKKSFLCLHLGQFGKLK